MAPLLHRVSNYGCGKRVTVRFCDDKIYDTKDGESRTINEEINSGPYTKIYRDFPDEDQGYLLNYDGYNLMLNDNRGKNKGIQDYLVHIWTAYDDINIDIVYDEMKIWCEIDDLGIYQSDGDLKYYKSVIARHREEGGISVIGFETAEGATTASAKKEEDENDEASAKMNEPNA
ncbi:putative protein [Arabidopsis thaliana]|uniref:F8M12.4 protein n=2 Tax=Arabidopsis thaliana TaxID=3702 RepID=O81626_ARATH|nr:uncharacterized protein AT4G10870 [Arabidopsis thaliana]AAC33948.1 F8M12.4 gene product [Arabidopsis thaliana]AEE82938.1 hypothetical protein AT4G10870 [Arabidopsis thaliana]CAB40055.1 putative protein [Arabidopsis thaliana]CAB81188.1 putative protein [Arabidopsis thaliana]VYS62251.1 unnamed protein product [Arabidopsis thaliana]|eukprot:NP_192825.1 hypothetical protein AT4G10870 [Arabidopsis thaliana]